MEVPTNVCYKHYSFTFLGFVLDQVSEFFYFFLK